MRPGHGGRRPAATGPRRWVLTSALFTGTFLLFLPKWAAAQIDPTGGVPLPVPPLEQVPEPSQAFEVVDATLGQAASPVVEATSAAPHVDLLLGAAEQVVDVVEDVVVHASGDPSRSAPPLVESVVGSSETLAGAAPPAPPELDRPAPPSPPPGNSRRSGTAATPTRDTPSERTVPMGAASSLQNPATNSAPSAPRVPEAVITSPTTSVADGRRDHAISFAAPIAEEPETAHLIRGPPAAATAAGYVSLVEWPG